QTPQGVTVGPCSQFKARATIRAVVVFPTPRTPVNIKAWAMRPDSIALERVRTSASCPFNSAKVCGRYFRAKTRYSSGFLEDVDRSASLAFDASFATVFKESLYVLKSFAE